MKERIVVDAGPLVALLDSRDQHHARVREIMHTLPAPMYTVEAVLSETAFRLAHGGVDPARVLDLILAKALKIDFQAAKESAILAAMMRRYKNVPMSFADACLVRLTELHAQSVVLTLDSDFTIYRRNGRQVVPTLMPQSK
ncbi:MAG TPA: type II toxin-antitoxin system VapC family toxin [Verrucomicrobia bacterium]|nr:type II toxin-antitoxin system VapC family toxin [Verrucomicrobiota bacterium]